MANLKIISYLLLDNIFRLIQMIWFFNCALIFIVVFIYGHRDANTQESQELGKKLFNLVWTEFSNDSKLGEGLGPLYNASSCISCHPINSRGGPPRFEGEKALELLIRVSIKNDQKNEIPHPEYGSQISTFSLAGVPKDGSVYLSWEGIDGVYGDGKSWQLRRPVLLFSELAYGPIDRFVLRSARIPPHLDVSGKIEQIADISILSSADPYDMDEDNISGRPNLIEAKDSNTMKVGRFGWKAGQYSLKQQVAIALIEDMGITTTIHPNQICPPVEIKCFRKKNNQPIIELDDAGLSALVHYTSMIGEASKSNDTEIKDSSIIKLGESLFKKSRCDQCHTPYLRSKSGELVALYSDLLLHDMGEGLADHRSEAEASGKEWRTPPLVGLGKLNSPYGELHLLHDGRARGFAEAILWHDGEAIHSKEYFRLMSEEHRDALLKYLESL